MSFSPKPCPHCGCTSFHVLPDILVEPHKSAAGGLGTQKIVGAWWRLTLVACTQCTRTELFSPTVAKLAGVVQGAHVVTSPR